VELNHNAMEMHAVWKYSLGTGWRSQISYTPRPHCDTRGESLALYRKQAMGLEGKKMYLLYIFPLCSTQKKTKNKYIYINY
jgi:hypothetical protein